MGSMHGKKTNKMSGELDAINVGAITQENLQLPNHTDKGKLAFVLHNVYTPQECQELIDLTEERGYGPALLNVGANTNVYRPDVRKSDRCIWDSTEQADRLWSCIKSFIPETFQNRAVIGLNERLRFLRYDAGDYFLPHSDGSYERDNGESSLITIQLYLNEGFEGGATTFLSYHDEKLHCRVVPKTGMVLVFDHNIYHEGSKLISGRKYAIRTDVMFHA